MSNKKNNNKKSTSKTLTRRDWKWILRINGVVLLIVLFTNEWSQNKGYELVQHSVQFNGYAILVAILTIGASAYYINHKI